MGRSREAMIECSKLAKRAKQEIRAARIQSVIAHMESISGYNLDYVTGALIGDGHVRHEKTGGMCLRLEVTEEAFARKFASCLYEIVPKTASVKIGRYVRVQKRTRVENPEYVSFTKERILVTWIVRCHEPGVCLFFESRIKAGKEPGAVRGFLDGLFDAEACFKKEGRGVGYRFCVHMADHNMIDRVGLLLSQLEIPSRFFISKTGYSKAVSVGRKVDLKRLCSIVKFSIPGKEAIRLEIVRRTI